MGILDPDPSPLNAAYLPGRVAQQEHVALEALDGEVLVDRADEGVLRLGDDIVVSVLRDGSRRWSWPPAARRDDP